MNSDSLRKLRRRWPLQVSRLIGRDRTKQGFVSSFRPISDALPDLLRRTLENLDSGQGFSEKIRQGGQGSVVGPLEYNGQVRTPRKIFKGIL